MKDNRYNIVGKLIRSNGLKTFSEIVHVIPKTRLALDLGINPERFNRMLENKELFVLKDLYALADLLEVDLMQVVQLIHNQLQTEKKAKRRK